MYLTLRTCEYRGPSPLFLADALTVFYTNNDRRLFGFHLDFDSLEIKYVSLKSLTWRVHRKLLFSLS